ncbi:MAG: hypothetical protein IT381_18460 [Deltaproteobacteria bacterium]|nr:hypothetical protein [Deltaproteobacteria bacterium]
MSRACTCAIAVIAVLLTRLAQAGPASQPATDNRARDRERQAFNAAAAELALPLFWTSDDNDKLDPDELAHVLGVDATERTDWVTADGAYTALAKQAFSRIARHTKEGPDLGATPEETARRKLVLEELRQAQPALIATDLRNASADERAFVKQMLVVAREVDALYGKQMGATELEPLLLKDDTLSRALFLRNHGPWCVQPATEKNKACNAIASLPAQTSALYPTALQTKSGFCEGLLKHQYARALSHPFSVVRGEGETLKPVPYHIVFANEMDAVSLALKKAAELIKDEAEAPLRAYLLAAAQAFRDNQWSAADDPWVKTGGGASKWYVRVAPDEAYADPCSRKAAFQLSFGRINERLIEWQKKLEPLRQTMEEAMAKLAGPPYKARQVVFRLPDFIELIANAGDARLPSGATMGQSLPIFGKIASEGRRRTVAMTNVFADRDSAAMQRAQAESVLCASALSPGWLDDPTPNLMNTILHEASHNLGPTGFYQVDGKTSPQIFGPQLSLVLSELHAQTAALYFGEWLRGEGLIATKLLEHAQLRGLLFDFDHLARGMTGEDGKPKPYSQLAGVQVAAFLKDGGLVWRAGEKAANGRDTGCLAIDSTKLGASVTALATAVSVVKAQGDRKRAEAMIADAISTTAPHAPVFTQITQRFRRFPKLSFVYSVRF